MLLKPRIEIGGGLYHIITRGNNRRKIFLSHDDYLKLTSILHRRKPNFPSILYAYCLMPNRLHLIIEMQDDSLTDIEGSHLRCLTFENLQVDIGVAQASHYSSSFDLPVLSHIRH